MTVETQATPKTPTWKQALLMLVGGAVLGCGGCAGFVAGYTAGGKADVLLVIGGLGFVAGVVIAIRGLIGLIVSLVRSIRKAGGHDAK